MGLNFTLGKAAFNIFITSLPNTPEVERTTCQEKFQSHREKFSRLSPLLGFPGGSVVKDLPANAGDAGSIPGSGGSPEEETATHTGVLAGEIHPMDREAWRYSP